MADDTRADMTASARHVYGPRPLAALLPALTRSGFSRHKPTLGQLLTDWRGIVGPALADVTAPRRLAAGTLTLGCAGPVALELQHLSAQLIDRINTALGRRLIERLRFVQVPPAVPPPPAAAATPARQAVLHATVARQLADIPPGPLRDALLGLGLTLRDRAAHPGSRPGSRRF